jgi:hypothetical protein
MNTKGLQDNAIKTVGFLRDKGDLIASFLLCSAFVEHYCKTRIFIRLLEIRPNELIEVQDKTTKKMKRIFITSKLKKIVFVMNQNRVIDLGLLIGAWNNELYTQLKQFNQKRNSLVHKYADLLEVLTENEKEVTDIINRGISLLSNIKLGYIQI